MIGGLVLDDRVSLFLSSQRLFLSGDLVAPTIHDGRFNLGVIAYIVYTPVPARGVPSYMRGLQNLEH